MKFTLILVLASTVWAQPALVQPAAVVMAEAFAVPTFHCLGLYWSAPGGAPDREVLVRYRQQGTATWKEGLPMRYNPIANTGEELTDYRGSIVHLTPATTYEVQLTLAGTPKTALIIATTWSETFPTGGIVRGRDSDAPLAITESGTPTAYRVYDGRGTTIDVRHQHDACITIEASYVIVRGFTLKGAGAPAGANPKPIGAILIKGGRNIVIEDCDISGWGRLNPTTGFGVNLDSAIYSRAADLERLVIQRCKLHDPACDGSNWSEPTYPTHSAGPQAISLFNTAGNHVIRYNECWSDLEHMFNDGIGGGSNGSFKGAPGPDSDVYGNVVSHCWDDGLEIEGGNRNVRVWNNYITQSMMMIANAATSIGPLYLWNNVVARSQSKPNEGGGNFIKMGFANGEQWMTGHMYVFHNTIFRADEWLPTGGFGGTRIVKHTVSRNNILEVRSPQHHSHSNNRLNVDNSYDYDLYNGQIPAGHEAHGIRGVPSYVPGAGFDPVTKTGRFQLAPESPGVAAGEIIPNFSDGFTGKAPDIGAHQRGALPIQYGVGAAERKRATVRADRLDRDNLLVYRATADGVAPVRTPADWQKRRAEILAGMQSVMGPLPGATKRVPLDVKVVSETDCGSYVRREITYAAEPGARVPAFLLVPKAVLDGKIRRPGILTAMPTNNTEGNRPVVGLQGPNAKPGRNYGEELAQRGFVVIVPPYPHLADYKPDLKGLGYASGTMKAIWDNIRALDVLAATTGVSPDGFGAIGHSLGGHNSIYTAVFDERIKAVVSSCGFDSYLDYIREKQDAVWRPGQGWTQERYMPGLAAYAGRLEQIPFDFHEMIGALAPRAFLALAPIGDSNFKWQSVDRVLAAARPVYQLHGVPDRLAVEHPDCEHDFPPEMREKAYRWLERFLK